MRWVGLAGALLMAASGAACIDGRDVGRLPRCGNQICDQTPDLRSDAGVETPANCPRDCPVRTCGNGLCEAGESALCDDDCPDTTCGDGRCDTGEDPYHCEFDCPWGRCGNFACESLETPESCPQDCLPGLCGNGICEDHEDSHGCPADCTPTRAVDLLVVIDNSESMAEEQWRLRRDFSQLLEAIREPQVGLPDLHIGVISTDLGDGFDQCRSDEGQLLVTREARDLLQGAAPYLVDVVPRGCSVQSETDGTCGQHDCTPANCAHAPETELVLDPTNGCPRCRNFQGTPAEVFDAMAALGTVGCHFEQPLESMYRALDSHPDNAGFVRADAILALLILSDEDDCSASDTSLFTPGLFAIDSALGPATSFRCFEFGVLCDDNDRTHQGVRHQCEPRIDSNRKLHRISRYTDELLWRPDKLGKGPGQVVVVALAGPVVADQVEVGVDADQLPRLLPSCATADSSAVPAIRLRAFVSHANDAWAMRDFAYPSVCESSYETTLWRMGREIRARLAF